LHVHHPAKIRIPHSPEGNVNPQPSVQEHFIFWYAGEIAYRLKRLADEVDKAEARGSKARRRGKKVSSFSILTPLGE